MEEQNSKTSVKRLMLIFLMAVMVVLASWGGIPQANQSAFFIGVIVLLGGAVAYFALIWHLLFRPLPASQQTFEQTSIPIPYRRIIAVMLTISGVNLVVGALWDEVWHRSYGIPFGEDFFWRPHLLIYSAILMAMLVSFGGLAIISFKFKGTFQQRFRTDPVLGLMTLIGGLMVLVIPTDPIWHSIYGVDLTAWSLPHIILAFGFSSIMILAIAVQLSTIARSNWESILHLLPTEWIVLVSGAFVVMMNLQMFTTEWDGNFAATMRHLRPEGTLALLLIGVIVFVSTMMNHSLRRYGTATATVLLSLLLRVLLLNIFQYELLTYNAWLISLPIALAIDIGYAFLIKRNITPNFVETAIIGTIGLALGSLPLISQLYPYPQVNAQTIPFMLSGGFLIAVLTAWLGIGLGNYFAYNNKQLVTTQVSPRIRLIPPLSFLAVLVFIYFFIASATPPIG